MPEQLHLPCARWFWAETCGASPLPELECGAASGERPSDAPLLSERGGSAGGWCSTLLELEFDNRALAPRTNAPAKPNNRRVGKHEEEFENVLHMSLTSCRIDAVFAASGSLSFGESAVTGIHVQS